MTCYIWQQTNFKMKNWISRYDKNTEVVLFTKNCGKIMVSNIGELLLLFTFLSILVSSVSYYYEAVLGFENKVPISEPIDNRYADSVVRCAMSCGSGCKCFNFNHHTGMCISYHSCHAFNMTVNELGWQLYYRPPLNTLGN